MEHLLQTSPNIPGYHIDHIIPISVFDCDNVEHIKLAHSPENLRWLIGKENLEKSDKIIWELIEASPKLLEIASKIGLTKV
jgi:hypothetical protein